MKNKTKIEIFAAQNCCDEKSCTCADSNFDLRVYSNNTDEGKDRAQTLGVTGFPAIAINDQPLNCQPIAQAIAKVLASEDCRCTCC